MQVVKVELSDEVEDMVIWFWLSLTLTGGGGKCDW